MPVSPFCKIYLQPRQSLKELTIAIRFFIILSLRISKKPHYVPYCLAMVVTSYPRFTYSASALASVQYCIIYKICIIAYQALCHHVYMLCLLLQENLFNFDYLGLIYLLSLLSWVRVHLLSIQNMLHSNVKSVENIAKFRYHLKTCLYTLPMHDNWICLLTLLAINPFVVMCLWAWFLRIQAQQKLPSQYYQLIGNDQKQLSSIYKDALIRKSTQILYDPAHPLNQAFQKLSSSESAIS